jgi:WD40 repeat protein
VCTLTGHSNWVTSVAFSADGKRVVSGSSDTLVKIWDADKGSEVHNPGECTTGVPRSQETASEGVAHVIPDAPMAPMGNCEIDASAPRWESVVSRNVKCATVNSTTLTCVKHGSHSDKKGQCHAVTLAED